MFHWRSGFVNRPLSRALYVAVRWASLVELSVALRVRQELTRLGLLWDIGVDFARIDDEQELEFVRLHPPLAATSQPSLPVGVPCQGVWV